MIGLVLAAGAGRRLRPHTDYLPKALVPIEGDTTVVDIILRNLAEVGLRDVAIVVGFAAEAFEERKAALEQRHGVNLSFVYNDRAETWNNAYSLWLARDVMVDGALMVNGDTVHPPSVERILLEHRGPALQIAVDRHKVLGEEEMKVLIDEQGHLTRITKLMDPRSAHGEYIGLNLIEPEAVAPLADALRATYTRDPGLYYEDGFAELVSRGFPVTTTAIAEDTPWIEVDDLADLERARKIACRS